MSADVQLTAEDYRIFDDFYARRLLEAGGARDDVDELEIVRDIYLAVVNDGLTPTADGGASMIRRSAMDWTDPSTVQAAQATTGNGTRKTKLPGAGGKSNTKEMVQGVLFLVVGLTIAIWYFWPRGASEEVDPTPISETPETEEAVATPIPTLESELLADIVDGGVKTNLVAPRTLEVKGVSFIIQPVEIEAGDWPMPDDPRAVSWVYGTVINYVLGMEATADNRELLSSLGHGDNLILRMSTGAAYRFSFADAVRVAPQASEIFRQTRPGLTIAMLGDEEDTTRVIIRALYQPLSELGLESQPTSVQKASLGETVVLDDTLLVTLLSAQPLISQKKVPGYVYVTVDYMVENRSGLPLVSGSLMHDITAGGMTYPVVSVTNRLPYGLLPEMLQPGSVYTTTSVYAVPEVVMSTETLVWEFAPTPTGENMVQVDLPPFTKPQTALVSVKQAHFQDGTLAVTFSMSGAGQDLELNAGDISVEGGTLSPIGNFFPWRLPAGSTKEFALLMSPTNGNRRMMVTLLNQGFELTY